MQSTHVSDLFSKVQDSLNSYCSASIVQLFLNSDQNMKMRELWDGFASKHTGINGGGPSLGGSNTPNGCSIRFVDHAIYNNVTFSAHGANYLGNYYEKLQCELVEEKSWNSLSLSLIPTCEWSAIITYTDIGGKGGSVGVGFGPTIGLSERMKFYLDSSDRGIPQEAADEMAKKIVEAQKGFLASNKAYSTFPPSPAIQNIQRRLKTYAIGAGVASTAFFAYRAYKEIRCSIDAASDRRNKAKVQASRRRALRYGAAAIASSVVFTVLALKI